MTRVILLALLALLSGCTSSGDQFQSAAVAFVAVVDVAAEARAADALDEDEVQAIDAAVDEGAFVLDAWADALKAGRDYPEGPEFMASVIDRIRKRLNQRE